MLDLLDSMAETTKYRSRIDDIFSIFLNVNQGLRSFNSFRLSPLSQKLYIIHLQLLVRRTYITQPRLTNTTRSISRSRLNSRVHDGSIFDFASWENISRDNWRNDRYIQKTFRLPEWIVVPQKLSLLFLNQDFKLSRTVASSHSTHSSRSLFPSTPNHFSIRLIPVSCRVIANAQTNAQGKEKSKNSKLLAQRDWLNDWWRSMLT